MMHCILDSSSEKYSKIVIDGWLKILAGVTEIVFQLGIADAFFSAVRSAFAS